MYSCTTLASSSIDTAHAVDVKIELQMCQTTDTHRYIAPVMSYKSRMQTVYHLYIL
jgi:hypothetical protein